MIINFYKYQGTGNDFVMLNNLDGKYNDLSIELIQKICDRRFGVGADGLIKINKHPTLDFEVDYYNSDGSKSFCGNGARCSVAFASTLGIDVKETVFMAIDGVHKAYKSDELVKLEMNDVDKIMKLGNDDILNTGSPHFIRSVESLDDWDIFEFGREIRYSEPFFKEGINVNLMEEIRDNTVKINTYERGVEDETLSCGTGATAAALSYAFSRSKFGKHEIVVHVKGGELKVGYTLHENGRFTDISLTGPAEYVFKGEIELI